MYKGDINILYKESLENVSSKNDMRNNEMFLKICIYSFSKMIFII